MVWCRGGVWCRWGCRSEGVCLGVSAKALVFLGTSAHRGVCQEGFSASLSRYSPQPPRWLLPRSVSILLECILDILINCNIFRLEKQKKKSIKTPFVLLKTIIDLEWFILYSYDVCISLWPTGVCKNLKHADAFTLCIEWIRNVLLPCIHPYNFF